MKLKIDNASYADLIGNRRTSALAINDNVSTTRHSRPAGGRAKKGTPHEYESRLELMKAFYFASKSKIVSVVADLANTNPIKAKVIDYNPEPCYGGIAFIVDLAPVGKEGK